MEGITLEKPVELEITIEELEDKVAPDGGETVLPVLAPKHRLFL